MYFHLSWHLTLLGVRDSVSHTNRPGNPSQTAEPPVLLDLPENRSTVLWVDVWKIHFSLLNNLLFISRAFTHSVNPVQCDTACAVMAREVQQSGACKSGRVFSGQVLLFDKSYGFRWQVDGDGDKHINSCKNPINFVRHVFQFQDDINSLTRHVYTAVKMWPF